MYLNKEVSLISTSQQRRAVFQYGGGDGATRPLPRDGVDPSLPIAPTSRRFNVVVRSPPLSREVGRNGETTTPRSPTILVAPIVWNVAVYLLIIARVTVSFILKPAHRAEYRSGKFLRFSFLKNRFRIRFY